MFSGSWGHRGARIQRKDTGRALDGERATAPGAALPYVVPPAPRRQPGTRGVVALFDDRGQER